MEPYLARAREWRALADALHAAGVTHPVQTVWRELMWCHLLASRGRAALPHLRQDVLDLTGGPADDLRPPSVGCAPPSPASTTPAGGAPPCVPPLPCR